MFAPFTCHWNVGVGDPLTAAVKVTLAPAVTAWLTGCVVMTGNVAAAVTVSVPVSDWVEPAELETETV